MKKLTTVFCSLCFMICGISLALYGHDSPIKHSAELKAATLYNIPKYNVNDFQIPLDLKLDQEKKADTQETVNLDVSEVTKTDNRVVKVPTVVERVVEVPVLYIATPVSQEDSVTYKYKVRKATDDDVFIEHIDSLDVES